MYMQFLICENLFNYVFQQQNGRTFHQLEKQISIQFQSNVSITFW